MNPTHSRSVFILVSIAVASAEAAAPAGRYNISADTKTVTDTKTGLVWQRDVPDIRPTWVDARVWCRNNESSLPGSGWRLPSIEELRTIVDSSVVYPAIDSAAFPNLPGDHYWYWSSTRTAADSSRAWVVYFWIGTVNTPFVHDFAYVRCVR